MLTEGLHIFKYKTPKGLTGKTILEADVGALTECNIIAIKKNGQLITNPHSSTVMEQEDILTMIGNMDQEEKFKEQFEN